MVDESIHQRTWFLFVRVPSPGQALAIWKNHQHLVPRKDRLSFDRGVVLQLNIDFPKVMWGWDMRQGCMVSFPDCIRGAAPWDSSARLRLFALALRRNSFPNTTFPAERGHKISYQRRVGQKVREIWRLWDWSSCSVPTWVSPIVPRPSPYLRQSRFRTPSLMVVVVGRCWLMLRIMHGGHHPCIWWRINTVDVQPQTERLWRWPSRKTNMFCPPHAPGLDG